MKIHIKQTKLQYEVFFANKPNYCINMYIVYLSTPNCYFDDFLNGIYSNSRKKGNILLKVPAFISKYMR